jgi:hypothetical protein
MDDEGGSKNPSVDPFGAAGDTAPGQLNESYGLSTANPVLRIVG